jgi:cell wall-associated NlpC family hydrolase
MLVPCQTADTVDAPYTPLQQTQNSKRKVLLQRRHLFFLWVIAWLFLLPGCSSISTSTQENHNGGNNTKQQTDSDSRIEIAKSLIGSPYRYGGTSPKGFDCSGFVYYVFGKAGLSAPRTTKAQFNISQRLPLNQARPGDLLFFKIDSRKLSHVGLYTGAGQFIHASTSQKMVSEASLDNPYWLKRFISVGRID